MFPILVLRYTPKSFVDQMMSIKITEYKNLAFEKYADQYKNFKAFYNNNNNSLPHCYPPHLHLHIKSILESDDKTVKPKCHLPARMLEYYKYIGDPNRFFKTTIADSNYNLF